MQELTGTQVKPPADPHREDADYAHMQAWRNRSIEAEHRLFDPRYGKRRLDLAQLVTHPDYQRRGLGRRLLRRGQQIASEGNLAIAVFASPMGKVLHEGCGFTVLDTVVVRSEDDAEILKVTALGWEPPGLCSNSGDRVSNDGI